MRDILLLTATIAPAAGVPSLAITDPSIRLGQYLKALDFYITQLGDAVDGIIFAENSGAPLDDIRALVERHDAGSRVELISMQQADAGRKGRGYAEFLLIEEAVGQSRLVAASPEARVWKISGRYIVSNLATVLKSMQPGRDFYCNCRDWPRRWADMFLIGWTRAGFDRLIRGIQPELDESRSGKAPETVWRDHVDAAAKTMPIQRRFRRIPQLTGFRGYDNADYAGWKYRARTRVREAVGRLLPFVWI